jgi:hypothetical protein
MIFVALTFETEPSFGGGLAKSDAEDAGTMFFIHSRMSISPGSSSDVRPVGGMASLPKELSRR